MGIAADVLRCMPAVFVFWHRVFRCPGAPARTRMHANTGSARSGTAGCANRHAGGEYAMRPCPHGQVLRSAIRSGAIRAGEYQNICRERLAEFEPHACRERGCPACRRSARDPGVYPCCASLEPCSRSLRTTTRQQTDGKGRTHVYRASARTYRSTTASRSASCVASPAQMVTCPSLRPSRGALS